MKITTPTQQSYRWQGTTASGQITSGEISAPSLNLAKMHLARKNIRITTIDKKPTAFLRKKTKILSSDITLFYRQLSTLIMAGIPIVQSLIILRQNPEQTKFFSILSALHEDINAGNNFANSLKKFPSYFDTMTCSLIYAGEKTGTLDILLSRIADHKENQSALKDKIQQILFYPTIITIVAFSVTLIMLIFIVPRFAELFQNTHSPLPFLTIFVISVAHCLQYSIRFILLFIFSIGGLFYYIKNFYSVKFTMDKLLLSSPLLGRILQKFILAQFTRNLAILFAAGIPITEALHLLIPTLRNSVYIKAIQKLYLDISTGQSLHTAMQTCKLFPPIMQQMIQVGEESGTFEKMLIKIAELYESDINYLVTSFSRLLEPLIMVVLGVLIGGLVIAMYLPIFKLGAVV